MCCELRGVPPFLCVVSPLRSKLCNQSCSGHACAMCGALRYRVAPRTGRDYAIFMAEKVQNSDQDAPFKSALSSLCQKHTIRVGGWVGGCMFETFKGCLPSSQGVAVQVCKRAALAACGILGAAARSQSGDHAQRCFVTSKIENCGASQDVSSWK